LAYDKLFEALHCCPRQFFVCILLVSYLLHLPMFRTVTVHRQLTQIFKRWSTGDGPAPKISPYSAPLIPPNRPHAFAYSAVLFVVTFGLGTGFYLSQPVPDEIPEGAEDRKPEEYKQKTAWDNSVVPRRAYRRPNVPEHYSYVFKEELAELDEQWEQHLAALEKENARLEKIREGKPAVK